LIELLNNLKTRSISKWSWEAIVKQYRDLGYVKGCAILPFDVTRDFIISKEILDLKEGGRCLYK
jgi:hypothetical protein